MNLRTFGLGVVAAVGIAAISSPAAAAPCVVGTEASYEALGAGGCTVGPVSFTNINITTTVLNGGVLGPIAIVPVTFVGPNGDMEYGLQLQYGAFAAADGAFIDIAWTYNVSAQYLTDAFLALVGTQSGTGQVGVTETLSNGVELSVTGGGGTDFAEFDPIGSLLVMKDQFNFAGEEGFATSSILTNAFSVTAVPGPLVGAGVPGLLAACGGLVALARRRRKRA